MDGVYPIEVLHVVNPHIIFVEARDESNRLVIEQVGIYGVVPVNQTLDIDGRLVAERSENWALVATSAINELLAGDVQAYFMIVQHETRSTIFDNNSVKFGHILIKTGKQIESIKDHLVKISVAEDNEDLFQKRLSSGSLKLKLNYVRTEEVLKEIRNYYVKHNRDKNEWETTLDRQTTLFQETKKISNKLTAENLERLQRNNIQDCNVLAVIERKTKDLDLCKDADLSSLGCGTRRQREPRGENCPSNALQNMKRFLNANSRVKHVNSSPNSDNKYENDRSLQNLSTHDDFWDKPYENESKINKLLKYNYVEMKSDSNTDKSVDEYVRKEYSDRQNDFDLTNTHSSEKGSANCYTPKNVKPSKNYHQDDTNDGYNELKLTQKREEKGYSPNPYSTENTKTTHKNDQNNVFDEPSPTLSGIRKGNIHQLKPKTTPERLVAYGPPCKADLANLKIHKLSFNAPSPYAMKTDEKQREENVEIAWNEDEVDFEEKVTTNQLKKEILKENDKTQESSVETNKQKQRDDIDDLKSSKHLEKEVTTVVNKNKAQESNFVEKNKQHIETKLTHKTDNSSKSETTTKDRRLLKLLKYAKLQNNLSSNSDTSIKTNNDSSSNSDISINTLKEDDDIKIIEQQLNSQYKPLKFKPKSKPIENIPKVERNVNPFNNLDGSKSVFVDKLVKPVLMVHTKNDNLILPQQNIRDVPFKTSIHVMLRNMNVKEPFRLQTVSWSYILRGHSVFLVGHAGGGKSLGYIPAVCNIVLDSANLGRSLGPICVIVCATAASVSLIEEHCKRFLGLEESVLSCYSGVDLTEFVPALLNGCDVLVITAPMLYRLLGTDFGVDLRRLTSLVFEDGERLSEVYASEIKVILHHVKDMLKNRADHSWKVQYVVASRQWCDFMTSLAKSAPDTVIAIAAFQECVPYSKTPTSVQFVLKENKVNAVLEFLNEIDSSKRTVIVCRTDDEVSTLEAVLKDSKRAVFSCNNAMTVHDLYNMNVLWDKYEEPVLGPVLICCDGNLTHMNVTNAYYLVHFSMPELFTMFCKRFAVLNENYASIFDPQNDKVKVKILLEDSNSEQLPKILHFVKRCTNESFPMLSEITQRVLEEKDIVRAERLVPICNTLMTLGECGDFWYCNERHAILKDYDDSKPWMPNEGRINFKITFYNSAVTYSARLLSNVTKSGTTKYPNNFNTLHMKMGMYYSKESNRKLQGVVQLGDVCAIAVKPNFFERCQVVKILSYNKGNPHAVLVNLIDEEKFETARDVHLFYLPEEFRGIETHVVKVRLANVRPQDKDVTFSSLARNELKKITESDEKLYLRGEVVMTVGNCIFVDSLEACQDLSSGETVVKYDLKKELLSRHAEPNPDHIPKLQKLGGTIAKTDSKPEVITPTKTEKAPKWAHLDKDDFSTVIFAAAENAGEFFVRLEKFQTVIDSLVKDIQKLVGSLEELPPSEICVGNIVLAEFPDDATYERARIDAIIDENKVKCFFVDNGDWREVSIKNLRSIPDTILHRVPFQAIECRLVGIKPPSDDWTDFVNNWFCDNCFENSNGKTKYLFAKYFTKEEAKITGGHKYGVILVDTSGDSDVVINTQMIELNLARENEFEVEFLNQPINMEVSRITDDFDEEIETTNTAKDLVPVGNLEPQNDEKTVKQLLFEKPIRSVPLYNSDDDDSEFDFNFNRDELAEVFKAKTGPLKTVEIDNDNKIVNVKAITDGAESVSDVSKDTNSTKTIEPTDSDDYVEKGKNEIESLRRFLKNKKETRSKEDKGLDSDDISSVSSLQIEKADAPKIIEVTDPPRKPKLVWRQNKNSITVKIQLIGVEQYNLDIKERSLKFHAYHNDTNYEFEFELYGLVNVKKCRHASKGQYILVVLPKIMKRNWLNLAKDCTVKNWMVYDVDALESSSSEEEGTNEDQLEVLKRNFEQNETDSDDEFVDDANFTYKRHI